MIAVTDSHRSKTSFRSITPRFPVADVREALSFYVDGLRFEEGWQWGSPPTHANVCRDSISLDLIAVPEDRQQTALAYVQCSGIDQYHAELRARDVECTDLANRDYGMRDFEVIDPWGNRIAFGEPVER